MSLSRPYFRTSRQLVDGSYGNDGHWQYVLHPRYAKAPEHYIRAFLLLQTDLQKLFEYVEPADQNLSCYSHRISELLLRASIEVEASCKAILMENDYAKGGDWRMSDYAKIEQSHRLSEYCVRVPTWDGSAHLRKPFAAWRTNGKLSWYQAYNAAKHDRHSAFRTATFEHMLDAVAACLVLLTAQFQGHDFSASSWLLSVGGPADGMSEAIGGYFRVKYPTSWSDSERYAFDWASLKNEESPFSKYPYVI